MVEDYRIQYRINKGVPTGKYEITKIGTKREIIKYQEFYQTPIGALLPEDWRRRIKAEIEEAGETELLARLKERCREYCAWIRKEQDLEDYAMDILASRAYLEWTDFLNLARNV